jgi:hypothetical protein
MIQTLTPSSIDQAAQILCCYVNHTSQIQIVRIDNIANWYFEKVVFPAQRLMFEAPSTAILEVHAAALASSILCDRIPCQNLQVQEAAAAS